MVFLPHQRSNIVRCALILPVTLLLAGILVLPAVAQEQAPGHGWWQIPTADLAYGLPLSIGFSETGAAWIGTRGGVNVLGSNGTRVSIPLSDPEVEVTAIAAAPDGSMWLATDSPTGQALGAQVIWPDGRQMNFTVLEGMADNNVRDIIVAPAGDLWFATAGGLGHLSADGSWGRFTRAAGLIDNDVYALASDAEGNLWIGTYAGISQLSSEGIWTNYTVADGLAGQWVRDLATDDEGRLWCATGLGVSIRHPDGMWETLTVADGLSTNVVNVVAPDESGGIWFATNEGANYLAANGQWLTFNQDAGLLSDRVVDVEIDAENQPWFATAGGLSVLIGGLAGQILPQTPAVTPTQTPPEPTETPVLVVAAPSPELPTPTTTTVVSATQGPPTPQAMNLERTDVPAFVEIGFYVILFLSILGAGVMLRHILLVRSERNRGPQKSARVGKPPGPEGVDVAWDEGLVPVAMNGTEGDALAAEVAEALAELDIYTTPGPEALMSPTQDGAVMPTANEIAEATELVPAPSQLEESGSTSEIRRKALESWLRRATVDDAEDLMKEGIGLAREGQKADAYDVFSSITHLVPDHVEAWLWKGGLAFHPRESVRCLQKALELDPDNEHAREGLDWAQAKLSAEEDGPIEE